MGHKFKEKEGTVEEGATGAAFPRFRSRTALLTFPAPSTSRKTLVVKFRFVLRRPWYQAAPQIVLPQAPWRGCLATPTGFMPLNPSFVSDMQAAHCSLTLVSSLPSHTLPRTGLSFLPGQVEAGARTLLFS